MDRQEFTALYERLRRPLYAYAAARLSAQVALDVVHDTFEVVWAKRDGAPSTADERAAWCFGIARNKVLQESQRTRRKHHDNRFLEDLGPSFLAASDDVADAVVEAVVGREVWDSLSPEDKDLLDVVASTELPGAEVAALLGISHVAYRRRVSRLRERIAKRWAFEEMDSAVTGGGDR
ncbi:MAG TPA: sigma factor [Arachnia sp.]|nr:sigma factor [Arachnia sp.]HMR12724.1 sigma factor [Arachnia sp.]